MNRKIDIYCPVCERAGIKRKLLEVDSEAVGIIYPYCKAHKENVMVELRGVIYREVFKQAVISVDEKGYLRSST